MGRGDNRRTPKVKRRKGQAKKKRRAGAKAEKTKTTRKGK